MSVHICNAKFRRAQKLNAVILPSDLIVLINANKRKTHIIYEAHDGLQ